jgi:hypothetical protein
MTNNLSQQAKAETMNAQAGDSYYSHKLDATSAAGDSPRIDNKGVTAN